MPCNMMCVCVCVDVLLYKDSYIEKRCKSKRSSPNHLDVAKLRVIVDGLPENVKKLFLTQP